MYLNYEILDLDKQKIVAQIALVDWDSFIGLLFPNSRCKDGFFNFKREEVLNNEELEILKSINIEINRESNVNVLPDDFARILEKLKWKALELIEFQIIEEINNSGEIDSKINNIKLKLRQSWQGVCGYFDTSIGFLKYRPDNHRLIVTIITE